jgi:pimeloyl-ACP methyl ester carboxylesterase
VSNRAATPVLVGEAGFLATDLAPEGDLLSSDIRPFRIEIPDAVLDDLRERLARTRYPDQLEGAEWSYGTELSYLKELIEYWRDKFDWRAQEARLNRFEHFKTAIGGGDLHFIHARSAQADALPLVITHGWPGSIVEFLELIPLLTDPAAHGGDGSDAFHVICPSMPGYGFSDAPRQPGFDVRSVAEHNVELMARLGYARYGAQGGDWGAFVTNWIGLLDPEHCAGIHLNMVVAFPPPGTDPTEGLSDDEKQAFADTQHFQNEETGYQQIQGTKPQTLGYGLNDSPAGLAAWIVEKFRTWSDCGGDLEKSFTKDELLTHIMVYWVTQSITSSTRLYCENRRQGRMGLDQRVEIPTGCAIFPKEIYRAPRKWAEQRFNVQHWTTMPRGGHFAAMEEPELLAQDLREFFRPLR